MFLLSSSTVEEAEVLLLSGRLKLLSCPGLEQNVRFFLHKKDKASCEVIQIDELEGRGEH